MKVFLKALQPLNEDEEDHEYMSVDIKFPMNSIKEMKSLEQKLNDEDIFKALLIKMKCLRSGHYRESCRGLMRQFFSNSLSCKVSWSYTANQEKVPLSRDFPNIVKFIMAHSQHNDDSPKLIVAIIKNYFRNSMIRLSNEKTRKLISSTNYHRLE